MKEGDRMESYQLLFQVCSIATVVMLFITVGLFFLLNISQVYRYLKGRNKIFFKVERSIIIVQTQEKVE